MQACSYFFEVLASGSLLVNIVDFSEKQEARQEEYNLQFDVIQQHSTDGLKIKTEIIFLFAVKDNLALSQSSVYTNGFS